MAPRTRTRKRSPAAEPVKTTRQKRAKANAGKQAVGVVEPPRLELALVVEVNGHDGNDDCRVPDLRTSRHGKERQGDDVVRSKPFESLQDYQRTLHEADVSGHAIREIMSILSTLHPDDAKWIAENFIPRPPPHLSEKADNKVVGYAENGKAYWRNDLAFLNITERQNCLESFLRDGRSKMSFDKSVRKQKIEDYMQSCETYIMNLPEAVRQMNVCEFVDKWDFDSKAFTAAQEKEERAAAANKWFQSKINPPEQRSIEQELWRPEHSLTAQLEKQKAEWGFNRIPKVAPREPGAVSHLRMSNALSQAPRLNAISAELRANGQSGPLGPSTPLSTKSKRNPPAPTTLGQISAEGSKDAARSSTASQVAVVDVSEPRSRRYPSLRPALVTLADRSSQPRVPLKEMPSQRVQTRMGLSDRASSPIKNAPRPSRGSGTRNSAAGHRQAQFESQTLEVSGGPADSDEDYDDLPNVPELEARMIASATSGTNSVSKSLPQTKGVPVRKAALTTEMNTEARPQNVINLEDLMQDSLIDRQLDAMSEAVRERLLQKLLARTQAQETSR